MIEYMSREIIKILLNEEIINREEQEIYQYGTELLVSTIVNLGFVLLMGMALENMSAGIIYFCVLATVRVQAGGYHASSYLKCGIVYAMTFLSVVGMAKLLCFAGMNSTCLMLSLLINTVYIWVNAPVLHNRVMKDEEKKHAKKKATMMGILWSITACVIVSINKMHAYTILASNILISAHMLLGKRLEELKNETKNKKENFV